MARAFEFEVFYDFIETLHELKFFLEGEAGINPFNYLDAYLFVRRSIDDNDLSSPALHMLNDAVCHTNTTHPAFHYARSGKTTEMKADILTFIDLLDEWRLSTSKFYGLVETLSHAYAFCILCEMYCDENEPAYSAIYCQQKAEQESAMPTKTYHLVKKAISSIRQAHFSLPCDEAAKAINDIDSEILEARSAIHAWENNKGVPTMSIKEDPFYRGDLSKKIIKELGIDV